MQEESQFRQWFGQIGEAGRGLADEIGVLLVANVRGKTIPASDYASTTIETEFLTVDELDELISSFHKAGFFVQTILDEEGFIEWLRGSGIQEFPRSRPVIYNLAQNGTGPARLSLVASLARLNGIPLLDSNAYAVALGNHKFHVASILERFGLPVARSWLFDENGWWPSRPPDGTRVIAKPTFDSASIGIDAESVYSVDPGFERKLAERLARLRQPLTVQNFIEGFEVELPVFECGQIRAPRAIGISLDGERLLGDRFLDFDVVFEDEYDFYDFRSEMPVTAEVLCGLAVKAFRCLGMETIGRVDFRVSPDGSPAIIEVASKPHLTRHGSCYEAVSLDRLGHVDLMAFLAGATAIRNGWSSIARPVLDV